MAGTVVTSAAQVATRTRAPGRAWFVPIPEDAHETHDENLVEDDNETHNLAGKDAG